jgi:hypothetical protein
VEGERSPSLQLYAYGAELLLVDEQGRRVGYDANTSSILTELPQASYYDPTYVPPGADPTSEIKRVVHLSSNGAGSYIVRAIQASTQSREKFSSFTITAVGYDSEFNRVSTVITGDFQDGDTSSYSLTYGSDNTIAIGPAVQLYLPVIEGY